MTLAIVSLATLIIVFAAPAALVDALRRRLARRRRPPQLVATSLSQALRRREHSTGVVLTITSAVTFGATGVLAKAAYSSGVSVSSLLGARFAIAARPALGDRRGSPCLVSPGHASPWPRWRSARSDTPARRRSTSARWSASTRRSWHCCSRHTRRSSSSWPIALGRERADRRRAIALCASIGGAVLVLGGARVSGLDGLGLACAASAVVAYATYVLLADRVAGRVDGLTLAALVITGAAIGTLALGGGTGSLDFALGARAWTAIGALAALCTVVPIAAFLIALPRIGPGTASILSSFETVIAVCSRRCCWATSLGPAQLAGAALVLGAALLLQLGGPDRVVADEPAATAAPAPARALA